MAETLLGYPAFTQGAIAGAQPMGLGALTQGATQVGPNNQWMIDKLRSLASGNDFYVPGGGSVQDYMAQLQQQISQGANQGVQNMAGNTMDMPTGGGGAAGAPVPTSDNQFTTIGQDNAWMSPDQLRAQTSSVQSGASGQRGVGGGEGGAIGIPGAASTQQGGSSNLLSNLGQPQGQVNPNFGAYQSPITGQVPQFGQVGGQIGGQFGGQAGGQMGQPGQGVQMGQTSPQDALQQYYNTPGYQALFGAGAQQQFQTSPGYQFSVDEAMRGVNQQASARGLLGSGAALKSLQDRAQGMAQQEYGNWWNRQNQLYGDYQNRLSGLAGANLGSQNAMQLGQGMGAGAYQTGSNVSSLLGSQGSAGFGGIVSTGAAQAGAMNNAAQMQAQMNATNQATQLAGATLASRGQF